MRSIIATAGLAALVSLASAAPAQAPVNQPPIISDNIQSATLSAPTPKSTNNGEIFPLSDGFPNPSPQQIEVIEIQAHGSLPNGAPPPTISNEGIINLQLIAFNELFEAAFFADLIFNITNHVPGFDIPDPGYRTLVIETLTAALAQEELHLLNANGALKHFNKDPIQPCHYTFPTTNFEDAIALAATFTDVVLGTLQNVIEIFAANGDAALTTGVASVVGQEGEQDGFYRILQNKNLIPNALPFLTTSTRDFAFSALQGFVIPGTCPNENEIPLSIFGVLKLVTPTVKPMDQTLTFSFDLGSTTDFSHYDWSQLTLQYINQQNVPVAEPLTNVRVSGTVITFDALFPFNEFLMNGLTIAAVTVGTGFTSAVDVSKATLFAPALIEVN
ncbi:late sexual development protein [Trichodelitschia bisporula]|uniref:Late sexual development protein n=1 Tax=Trichodelitschia bisporula TaxID=703511 RepID=A0A6G1I278_9PEZI|nr:late sexual development protein [Trichodelitschia bisporula]